VFRRSTPQYTHLDEINDVTPSAEGCEECLQMGDTWVHLRECLICGHVGCCDASVSPRIRNALYFHATLSPTGEVSSLALARVA
jgi:hypothetical protein